MDILTEINASCITFVYNNTLESSCSPAPSTNAELFNLIRSLLEGHKIKLESLINIF